MKIVRVIARLNVGGPSKHVVWLTKGLQSPDCESILVAGTVPPSEEDMSYFATELGVTPFFLPEMSREVSPKDLLTIWKLYKLFLRERPDIVHTHTAKAGTVGRVAGWLYRWATLGAIIGRPRACKFVHTYHGHIFHNYYGRVKTGLFLFVEKVLAWAVTDRIVVVSEQQRREINEEFGVGRADRFSIIPLGLDIDVFAGGNAGRRPFRDQLGVGPSEILIGIVGRLTEIKNHELFLRAAADFKTRFARGPGSPVRFVVIGDGSLRSQLQQQALKLGLNEDVIFAGSRRDIALFYRALDIVALTSRNEGTPLTLIEAMANSRPVVSTAVGGVVDLLGEALGQISGAEFVVCERGVSVRPNDHVAFSSALARLVTDEKLREETGNRGFEFVKANYSKDRLLRDISRLYSDLLKRQVIVLKASAPQNQVESGG
ncbi:MAG: glycosyltransferase [Pyrinomonadaceae bacterium]